MKISLTARFGRRDELREIAKSIRSLGYVVTSSWLEQEEDSLESPDSPRLAARDLSDIIDSDVCVAFTDLPGTPGAERGGRHVEFGAAAILGQGLIVCGPVEHIFHTMADVVRVESTMLLLEHLKARLRCDECDVEGVLVGGNSCGETIPCSRCKPTG